MLKTAKDLVTGNEVPVVRAYKTAEHGFLYEIMEEIEGGYIMSIPCPSVKWYKTNTDVPYANSAYVRECVEDFGLCELDREWLQDGTTRIYGF